MNFHPGEMDCRRCIFWLSTFCYNWRRVKGPKIGLRGKCIVLTHQEDLLPNLWGTKNHLHPLKKKSTFYQIIAIYRLIFNFQLCWDWLIGKEVIKRHLKVLYSMFRTTRNKKNIPGDFTVNTGGLAVFIRGQNKSWKPRIIG